MKTSYQFIHFTQAQLEGNPVWNCANNRSNVVLGYVAWYRPWKRHCYFPAEPAVYSDGCLRDILHFIGQLTAQNSERLQPELL